MKYSFVFLAASIGILAACSGIENNLLDEPFDDVEITEIYFNVPPIIDEDIQTKASAVPQPNNSVDFAWEATDKIGIFPDQGSQIYFVPEDGVGTNHASFTGGGWALKPNSTYVSYYPFVADYYLDRNAIPVSFAGQKQTGIEGPFDGARYVLATSPVQSQNGRLTFVYNTLNTIINVLATLPAGTYTNASLNIAEPLFVEEGTFSLDDQEIVGASFSKTLAIELEDFTLTENAEVPIYFLAAPVDLTGKEITVIITKDDGTRYKCVKTPSAPYNAGRRRGLTCAMQKDAEIINFVDPEVKRLCVENWDTDGDGELDMDEAAAVTDLGSVFTNNKQITSFNELQYFTGLSSIGGWITGRGAKGFAYCTNLASVILPNSVGIIDEEAFFRTGLVSIELPDGVTIWNSAFALTNITSLVIPRSTIILKTNETGSPFGNCKSLSSVTLNGPLNIYTQDGSSLDYDVPLFAGCGELKTLTIGEAFSYNCLTSLGSYIGTGGYYNDVNYETIIVSPKNPVYDSRNNCNAIIETSTNTLLLGCKNTVIPESVTAIGSWALSGVVASSITIPESVHTIGDGAFASSSLSSVIVLAANPPTLNNYSFGYSEYDTFPIYVPAGSVNAYKTAAGWSDYADRIFSVEEYVVPGSGDDGND